MDIHCSIGICTPIPMVDSGIDGVKRLAPITPEWHRGRSALVTPTGNNIAEIYVDGTSVDDARNKAAQEAVDSNMKYLFFIDYDTIPTPDSLCRLVYHLDNNPEYDIAAGLYCTKSSPPWPLLWREWGNGVSWDFTLGEVLLDNVVGVPMGCTLLRVSLFERLPHSEENPWFRTVAGPKELDNGRMIPESGTEDLWLCQRLEKEIHGKILMDTGILCDHIHNDTGLRYTLPDDCLPRKRAKEHLDKRNVVLHVGCGPKTVGILPEQFRPDVWHEVRLDIDASVQPDIVSSITDMRQVRDDSCKAVWSSHNIEHLHPWEVELALSEFHRVLKSGGIAFVQCPDIEAVAAEIVSGRITEITYESEAGPIRPLDMIFGYSEFLKNGNKYQAHKTGFTAETLEAKMKEAGFAKVEIQKENFTLIAQGLKG
jgi:predicted SAM-dependent methyltransferase